MLSRTSIILLHIASYSILFFFRVVPMQDLKGSVSLRITELKEGEEVGYEMVTKALENSTLRIKFMVTIFNYE